MSINKGAILQPTFMPWLGWFDLIDQVEVAIMLDDVPFSKQSWQQRNRIRTQRGLDFLTIPIKSSGKMGQLICECEIANHTIVNKINNSLRESYARAPFFKDLFEEFASTLKVAAESNRLVDINFKLIQWFIYKLNIKTKIVNSSVSYGLNSVRGARVAELCKLEGINSYLSPMGAEGYLKEDKNEFVSRGISVDLHVYEHPIYTQRFAPFIPYASIIDLMFNEGPSSLDILRRGRRSSRPLFLHNEK